METPPSATNSPAPAKNRSGRLWVRAFTALALALAAAAVFWNHIRMRDLAAQTERRNALMVALMEQGLKHVELRQWNEADRTLETLANIAPESPLANIGRLCIAAGKKEEQTQFVGYWSGQAIAELEAGRFDQARSCVAKITEKFPGEEEAASLVARIQKAKEKKALDDATGAARMLFAANKWQEALEAAQNILKTHPGHEPAKDILKDSTAILEKLRADKLHAAELLKQAVSLDHGEFNATALDILTRAASLDPGNREIARQLEKMSAYTRTLRVPGDFATPGEAVRAARDNDRIVLGEARWSGPLVLSRPITLQGAGQDKSFIECAADAGCAIAIPPHVKGVRVSGITFRHTTFKPEGKERFSAALVRGEATFTDCGFSEASGHGLVATDAGRAKASHCRFNHNGWNGASAFGKDSMLEVRNSETLENFEHGFETWDGASCILADNRCAGNGRNGIHIDIGEMTASITGNLLLANREFGLVLASAGSGDITGNSARENLLGGFVVRKSAAKPTFTGNTATRNEGPGLVLEKDLPQEIAGKNQSENNRPDVQSGIDLSAGEEPAPTPPDH